MTDGKINRDHFMMLLTERFPEVVDQINDIEQGLLHLEMAAFSRATRSAIEWQDRATVEQHLRFVDEVFRDAAPDVENAICVTYLENLHFDGWRAGPMDARSMLPPLLDRALTEIEQYFGKLNGEVSDP